MVNLIGGIHPFALIISVALGLFFLAILCARRDSIVRCLVYTAILIVLGVYLMWWQLIPEIRAWHNLIPADCLVAGNATYVDYTSAGNLDMKIAMLPVDVSHIECHGQVGHDMDMTNVAGSRNVDPKSDVFLCKIGASIYNGSTAYIKIKHWGWLDADEQVDAVGRYEQGLHYFCWVDPTTPSFVTFVNEEDWTAIFFPMCCIFLVVFLCWSAGSFSLFRAFVSTAADPFFLRIDATTPTESLRKMRGDDYEHLP
mmetsp:Transcript_71320/g.163473  ORF Transcript_71320/g.163473 Transcript_71320/m.163473 type:complete len:255 (-) Transcript_71320:190-954(-)